jgi:hypothetical protein
MYFWHSDTRWQRQHTSSEWTALRTFSRISVKLSACFSSVISLLRTLNRLVLIQDASKLSRPADSRNEAKVTISLGPGS